MKDTQGWLGLLSLALASLFISSCASETKSVREDHPSVSAEEAIPVLNLATGEQMATDFKLYLQSEIVAPKLNGVQLQATDIVVRENWMYVSYNRQGEQQMGGIQVFDITEPKKPVLASEVFFKDHDVNAIDVGPDAVYLTGASSVPNKEGAYVKKIFLDNHLLTKNGVELSLSGFAGNGISVKNKKLFVTVGDKTGLIVLNALTFATHAQRDIYDARDVAVDRCSDTAYVVSGQPTTVQSFMINWEDFNLHELKYYTLLGSSYAQSKSTILASELYTLVSMGESGFSLVCNRTKEVMATESLLQELSRLSIESVVNSVAASSGLIVASYGASGLFVYTAKRKPNTEKCEPVETKLIGKMSFDYNASTNHVYAQGKMMYVATGSGGVKIISINREFEKSDLRDFDDADNDSCLGESSDER